jgi:hypothetical protein
MNEPLTATHGRALNKLALAEQRRQPIRLRPSIAWQLIRLGLVEPYESGWRSGDPTYGAPALAEWAHRRTERGKQACPSASVNESKTRCRRKLASGSRSGEDAVAGRKRR